MDYIWGYFIHLGNNMWRDTWSNVEHRGPHICQATARWQTKVITDRAVWRDVVDFLPSCGVNTLVIDMGEGVQYDSHPELSNPGAWSKDELRAEVKRIRAMGMEPVPKLNFSSYHDAWLQEYSWMKGTAKYYEVVKDLIDEVAEIFAPVKYFHLGMDEESVPNHRKGMTIIRCDDLWYHDLYYYIDCIEKHGARPLLWGSYYRFNKDTFAQKMPKDCILVDNSFERVVKGPTGRYVNEGFNAVIERSRLGYDQLLDCSVWCCKQNVAQAVLLARDEGLFDEHMLGLLASPWAKTTEDNHYALLDMAHRMKYAKPLYEEFFLKGLEKRK